MTSRFSDDNSNEQTIRVGPSESVNSKHTCLQQTTGRTTLTKADTDSSIFPFALPLLHLLLIITYCYPAST